MKTDMNEYASRPARNVRLHIERLVLDGLTVAHAERPVLQAAVARELARLLAEGGISPALQGGGARHSLTAGGIEFPAEEDAAGMGAQIARAVYEGIGS
jgi:hypothetical protein